MKKFDSLKHYHYIERFPFSYFSLLIYLDFIAYSFERNGENLVVWQDTFYPHDFPSIFIPEKKENWKHASIALATIDDIKKIKNENIEIKVKASVEIEYFYKTENFVNPKKKTRNHVENFKKLYEYNVLNKYPIDKILEFNNKWKKERSRVSITLEEEEKFFLFCLNNLDKYCVKQVYVEIGNKLAGFAWGVNHSKNNWVGLELKADYKYKGLSRFLQSERAKMFLNYEFLTLGTGCHDKGITEYKKGLGPNYTKEYFYLLTRENIFE